MLRRPPKPSLLQVSDLVERLRHVEVAYDEIVILLLPLGVPPVNAEFSVPNQGPDERGPLAGAEVPKRACVRVPFQIHMPSNSWRSSC